jgi:hypothetical protein
MCANRQAAPEWLLTGYSLTDVDDRPTQLGGAAGWVGWPGAQQAGRTGARGRSGLRLRVWRVVSAKPTAHACLADHAACRVPDILQLTCRPAQPEISPRRCRLSAAPHPRVRPPARPRPPARRVAQAEGHTWAMRARGSSAGTGPGASRWGLGDLGHAEPAVRGLETRYVKHLAHGRRCSAAEALQRPAVP